MTITRPEAGVTSDALDIALATITGGTFEGVRQVRYELEERAREWANAIDLMDNGDEAAVIELVDNVVKGMYLIDLRRGRCRIRRKLNQGTTLHMEDPTDPDPRGFYVDFYSGSSPVVVAP